MPLSVDALPQPGLDDRLAEHPMPSAGPDFYNARRQLWLTPPQGRSHILSPPPSFSADLEDFLQADEALHANSCWNKVIDRVWARLSKGVRLKNRLPLGFVVCFCSINRHALNPSSDKDCACILGPERHLAQRHARTRIRRRTSSCIRDSDCTTNHPPFLTLS